MQSIKEESTIAGASTNNLTKVEILRKLVELTKKQNVNILRFNRMIRAAHNRWAWAEGEKKNWEATK